MHGVTFVYTLCRGIVIEYCNYHILCHWRRLFEADMPWSGLCQIRYEWKPFQSGNIR